MSEQKPNPNYPFHFIMPRPARDYPPPNDKDKERIARRRRFDDIEAQRELNRINREADDIG